MSQKMTPGVVPKGDVSYIRATSGHSGAYPPMSPPAGREKNSVPMPVVQGPQGFEWNEREELLSRELEEAKIRASQMEKTMRWWSDCTANWREKWNKARNERNKAREENRQLRSKLESAVKEQTTLKRERQEMVGELEHLKKQLELYQKGGGVDPVVVLDVQQIRDRTQEAEQLEPKENSNDATNKNCHSDDSAFMDQLIQKQEDAEDVTDKLEKVRHTRRKVDNEEQGSGSDASSLAEEKVTLLQMKLEEAQKNIQAERIDKEELAKSVEKLETELNVSKLKFEEIRRTKQEAEDELHKLRNEHQDQLERMASELEDETSSRSSIDRRVAELRRELERLQAENASEWGKRERLETEKLALERENKKLRNQVEDLEEQLERKNQQASAMIDSDMKTLQFDLSEKNKELNDLRHVHGKLKKALQEKTTELDHNKRRSEQYELEVKKLRGRVEELKKDLALAEDEVDVHANSIRKLQRNNDELQEQVENLQVQVEHLQSRLRRNSQPLVTGRASSLKSFSMEDHVGVTVDSDEDLDDEDT